MASDGDRVGMGLFFYPRGGSAQVVGYLSRALERRGWDVTLVCGSLGGSGALGNAATFFGGGLDVVPGEYDDAVARWERGEDPMDAPFPFQPSYEARPGVPDRGFPWVSPAQGARMAAAWARVIAASGGMSRARLLHLHHLTPLHAAVAAALPGVPVVTHLHGTELRMLDAIARANPEISEAPHAQWWASHLRRAARRAVATITISPYDRGEAVRLLGLDPATVSCIPNGVDVERFANQRPSLQERRSHWLGWLVRDPHGWDEATGTPGSVGYTEGEVLDAFFDATSGEARPVLMFVGRFLAFKRVPLLVRAYARARARMSVPAPLVVCGGVPGEWEGEHPHTVARAERVGGVFFTGWRGHDHLPLGLSCADCFVAPSANEPFGLVYLEAMACQLPVIGTQSGGPPSFINLEHGQPDGWLVPPDDETALTDAIVTAINTPTQRTQRGTNASRHARQRYSWHRAADRLVSLYQRHANERTTQRHS